MRFETRLKPTSFMIDMTPLVDVVFLLLVFFIVTSDTLPLKSLKVERPELVADTPTLTSQLAIVIDAQHVIYLGSQKSIVDTTSLREELAQELANYQQQHSGVTPTVVLNVDQGVQYGIFLQVFNTVQQLGLPMKLAYREK